MDLLKNCGRCTRGYVVPTEPDSYKYKCDKCHGAGKVPVKVLLVEDEKLKRNAIRRTIRRVAPGVSLGFAANLAEARALIPRYDLILTDMSFPFKEGQSSVPNAGLHVKHLSENQGKTVVVISGSDMPDGFDGYWITFSGGFESQLEQYLKYHESL